MKLNNFLWLNSTITPLCVVSRPGFFLKSAHITDLRVMREKKARACTLDQALYFHRLIILQRYVNPPVHCSSCTLGVSRSRSVKFAPVRKRRKGGGACELSSAELPLIRPFASLASTWWVCSSACIPDERVCISSRVMAVQQPINASFSRDYKWIVAIDRVIAGEHFGVNRRCIS